MALFLDELAQLDQREASQVAYLLANGKGKSRMRSDITMRKSLTWTLIFVSSGETTLSAIAEKTGQLLRGGAEIRLLNLGADAGAGLGLFENLRGFSSADAFAHRLKRSARQYYGSPFRAYLQFLVRNMDDVKKAVRSFILDFLNKHVPSGASGEVSRVAERLALIAAAGEIATSEAKVTGWEEGEAEAAAARFLKEWIDARGTTGGTDTQSAIGQVRRFIEQHGQSRFQDADLSDQEEKRTIINRAGVRRKTGGETEYLIFPETFKKDVCAGFDYKQVAQALDKKGLLVRDGTRLTHNARVPGIDGTARFFCVKGAVLGES